MKQLLARSAKQLYAKSMKQETVHQKLRKLAKRARILWVKSHRPAPGWASDVQSAHCELQELMPQILDGIESLLDEA